MDVKLAHDASTGGSPRLLFDAIPVMKKLSVPDHLFIQLAKDYLMLEDKRFGEDLLCPDCDKPLDRTHALSCMQSGRRHDWHGACEKAVLGFGYDTMLQPTKKQRPKLKKREQTSTCQATSIRRTLPLMLLLAYTTREVTKLFPW